jgi:hypothetical protein
MFKKDYNGFKESWKSCSFKIIVVLIWLISLVLLIGGLVGMFYTPYVDVFAVMFMLGVALTLILILYSVMICIGCINS